MSAYNTIGSFQQTVQLHNVSTQYRRIM